MKKSKTMIVTFLLPAVLAYLIIYLYPTIRTLWMSFNFMEDMGDPMREWTFVGINNYINLFKSDLFVASLKNLVKVWVIGIVIVFPISMILAVVVTSKIKFRMFFKAVIYMPAIISPIAMGTMWVHYIYNPKFGFLHTVFKALHLEKLSKIVYLAPDRIFMSMLIGFCFVISGYFMLVFSSAMQGIPHDYYDAATLETNRAFDKFRYITFPLLRPTMKTCLILWTLQVANFFIWPQLFSQFNMAYETVAPVNYLYSMAFGSTMHTLERSVGVAACIGVLMFFFILAAYLIVHFSIKDTDIEY